MRILFLSHYFPPEVNAPASRVFEHARRWVADGHEVEIVTGVPNHPRGELFPGYTNRWLQEEWVDGIRVLRTWMYLAPNEGVFRRTVSYVLFAVTAVLASLKVKRPDVVVATSPQFFCGIAGALASRLKRRPFVLEVRDLWPASIVELDQLRSTWLIRLLERVETLLYRSAAGIVVNTRAFIEHIAARGIERERICLVYNGIDPEKFHPRPHDVGLLGEHGLRDRYVVAYIGTLGLAHGLTTVLDAAEKLAVDQPEITFLLIGEGAERARLEREIRERGLANVRILGLRPREEIPAWVASSDVLLVTLRDLPVFETVIPSKLFEFLAMERPVVLAARGEVRRLLEQTKAGTAIDPEDPDALRHAILQLKNDPQHAASQARRGRDWVHAEFQRDELARKMAAFLEAKARIAP